MRMSKLQQPQPHTNTPGKSFPVTKQSFRLPCWLLQLCIQSNYKNPQNGDDKAMSTFIWCTQQMLSSRLSQIKGWRELSLRSDAAFLWWWLSHQHPDMKWELWSDRVSFQLPIHPLSRLAIFWRVLITLVDATYSAFLIPIGCAFHW